ncbi:hypothetical protein [Streptomyces sp. NPDC002855]|uniref:hypothetical protein n=1 Tax=Streptomyces sp. NPDC002855 TaxID=3154437 RepID=UPI00332F8719
MTPEPIPGVDGYAANMAASVDDQFGDNRPAPAPKAEVQEMSQFSKELVARVKEIFFAYTNRMERNAQTTLGPSEIGTPCDRRLVMHLLGVDPVNPGGDNWASFRGTCTHVGLAEMFDWANANTGRFATEIPLTFPSVLVPKGTGDLLDRVLLLFVDHKTMGSFSLTKLKTEGLTPTQRVQLNMYAYGATLRGEVVERIAVLGWPIQNSTLQALWAVDELYDEQIALDALARVERLGDEITDQTATHGYEPLQIAGSFSVDASDCKFCPYYMPNAKSLDSGGCNGKA